MKEPFRFSFHHIWNYVFLAVIVAGLVLFWLGHLDGRILFGAAVLWAAVGRLFIPAIIHEHLGFLNRWVFNDYKKAHKRYLQAVNTGKATSNAYCALGSLAYAEGDFQESVLLLQKAADKLSKDVPVRVLLARALLKSGRIDEAFGVAQQCLHLSHKNPKSYIAIGDVLREKQDLVAAASAYQNALSLVSKDFHSHISLFDIFTTLGETKEANAHLATAFKLDSEHPDLLYVHAMQMWSQGKLQKAKATLQKALEKRPIKDRTYHTSYAGIVKALGGVNEAIDAL